MHPSLCARLLCAKTKKGEIKIKRVKIIRLVNYRTPNAFPFCYQS